MKRSNKKGFTIVELVIVIAVIAILAAVLIPTFVNLVKKANMASDQQSVKQMNTQIDIASAEKAPADLDALIDILAAAGYNAEDTLVPVSKNHTFYWYKTYNCLILVNDEYVGDSDAETEAVVFPTDNDELIANFEADLAKTGADQVLFDLRGGYIYVDIVANSAETVENALNKGNEKIKLDADLKVDAPVTIPAGSNVLLDLNGHKLTTDVKLVDSNGERRFYVDVARDATLTLVNGTVDARGIGVYGKVVIGENANVIVNAVDNNGGAALWVYAGGEVEINGGTFTALNGTKNGNEEAGYGANPGVVSNAGKITINGGTFKSAETICYLVTNRGGEMIINGGTFEGTHGIVAAPAGTVTINGGTFKLMPYADGSYDGHVVWTDGSGAVIVNGGTFVRADGANTNIFTGNVTDNR